MTGHIQDGALALSTGVPGSAFVVVIGVVVLVVEAVVVSIVVVVVVLIGPGGPGRFGSPGLASNREY